MRGPWRAHHLNGICKTNHDGGHGAKIAPLPTLRPRALLRHHDLAEVLVGFHVLEGFGDLVEWIDLVDRQFQFAGFHRRPDVLFDFTKYLADFLDRAGPEGHADVLDTAG